MRDGAISHHRHYRSRSVANNAVHGGMYGWLREISRQYRIKERIYRELGGWTGV